MSDDTEPGGDDLSIEQAAAAYAKSVNSTEAAPDDEGQAEDDEIVDEAIEEADAEDEDSEDEGETDEEGQSDEEDETEPDTERGRYVAHNGRVRLPDGTESTVADLIQGNLRDRDYRQKTMATAELKREVETRSAALKESEQELEQQRQYITELVRSIVPAEPDPSLLQSDPLKYMQDKAARDQWIQHLTHLDGQRQQTAQKAQEEANRRAQETAQTEWAALLEAVPELSEEAKLTAFANDLKTYGNRYKLTPQEIGAIPHDHRFAVIMRKAIAYDKLQADKPKAQEKLKGRPPVQRGGKRQSPGAQKARQANDALSRLKETGSTDDAVAAYLASLNKG